MGFPKLLSTIIGLDLGVSTAIWVIRNKDLPITHTHMLNHRGHIYECRVQYTSSGLQAITVVYVSEAKDFGQTKKKYKWASVAEDTQEYLDASCLPFPILLPPGREYMTHLMERDYQRRRWIQTYRECSPIGGTIFSWIKR